MLLFEEPLVHLLAGLVRPLVGRIQHFVVLWYCCPRLEPWLGSAGFWAEDGDV